MLIMNLRPLVAALDRLLQRHHQIRDRSYQRRRSADAVKLAADSVRECAQRHYEYFENIYYTEERRRDAFATGASFLLGALGVAGAIWAFYLRDVVEWIPGTPLAAISSDWTAWLYLLLLAIDLVSLIVAAVFLINVLYGYTYQYLASPLEIRQYYQTLVPYYGNPIDAEAAFQDYLTDQYAHAANTNDQNNITRRKHQYRCTGWAISLFIGLALTFVLFFSHKLIHRERQPLPVKWDNAQITVHESKLYSPIVFDNTWPCVPLFTIRTCPYAEGSKTNP